MQFEGFKTPENMLVKKVIDENNIIGFLNLWKQNIGSKVDLEQKELAFKNSKNNLFSAKVRYDNLKRQLILTAQQSQNNLKIVQKQENDFILKSEVSLVSNEPR